MIVHDDDPAGPDDVVRSAECRTPAPVGLDPSGSTRLMYPSSVRHPFAMREAARATATADTSGVATIGVEAVGGTGSAPSGDLRPGQLTRRPSCRPSTSRSRLRLPRPLARDPARRPSIRQPTELNDRGRVDHGIPGRPIGVPRTRSPQSRYRRAIHRRFAIVPGHRPRSR